MPSNDPDIRNEPHLRPGGVLPNYDPAIDAPLAFNPHPKQFSPHSEEDVDHSVWDEPSLTPAVAAAIPESALTYANWLNEDERTGQNSMRGQSLWARLCFPSQPPLLPQSCVF